MLSTCLQEALLLETEIDTKDLKKFLDEKEKVFLLDVRTHEENNICQIVDSVNVPLTNLSQNLDKIPKDFLVVTICHHGIRSLKAAMILKQNGYDNVLSLEGGIHAWALHIEPTMSKY